MESYHYEWRIVHDGVGRVPNIRCDSSAFFYNNCFWVMCGAGSGLGKSNEAWKFDTSTKLWSRAELTPQESPPGRDGLAGTYIGDGKFVIFGGQGFSEPNKKLGKESDQMRAQTYCKRDVFNDLWMFDCNTEKWTPIYPDGLSFPMGRRGHSMIYIPRNTMAREEDERQRLRRLAEQQSNSHDEGSAVSHMSHGNASYKSSAQHSKRSDGLSVHDVDHASLSQGGHGHHHHHHRHKDGVHFKESFPENSLVVFGGAGIELSKYTEQLYNDVWVYSFDSNTWHRHETQGIEPPPMTNHRAMRSGETMIVAGGVLGSKDTLPGSGSSHTAVVDGDVLQLNLRTATWSVLRVVDHTGKPTKINSLGFSLVQDVDPALESLTYAPPRSLLVFGGKENVDSRTAATTRQTKRQQMIQTSFSPVNARRLSQVQRSMLQSMQEKTYHHFHADGDILDPWSVSDDQLMLLDVEHGTLTVLQTKEEGTGQIGGGIPVPPPEGRYGHMAVAAMAPREYAQEQLKEAEAAKAGGNKNGSKHGRSSGNGGFGSPGRTVRGGNTNRSSRSAYGGADVPAELPVMYVFGGCRLENNGYCDPSLYALVKVFHVERGGHSTHPSARSEVSHASALTSGLSLEEAEGADTSAGLSPAVATPTSPMMPALSPMSTNSAVVGVGFDDAQSPGGGLRSHRPSQRLDNGGMLERSTFSAASGLHNNTASAQSLHQPSALETLEILNQPSIWSNIQRKEQIGQRNVVIKNPSNWDEMKLVLTNSRSNRLFHSGEAHADETAGSNQSHSGEHGGRKSTASLPHHTPPTAGSAVLRGSTSLSQLPPPTGLSPARTAAALRRQNNHSSGGLHTQSTATLHEFTFRTVSSYNRGALYSPWTMPVTLSQGLEGTSPLGHESPTTGADVSAPGSRVSTSHGGRSQVQTARGKLHTPPTAQQLAVEKEEREARIKLIKATLKPVITRQTKVVARETYQSLFPMKPT